MTFTLNLPAWMPINAVYFMIAGALVCSRTS
jgi:hypothetical protein